MDASQALLESWTRQARIVRNLAQLVDERNRYVKPSEDGWPILDHLAHVHGVRRYWLSRLSPERAAKLDRIFADDWHTSTVDPEAMRVHLQASAAAVHDAVKEALDEGVQEVGGYDHPVLFLQHMIWHEGWHVGLIMLGLRIAGQEPTEEWDEKHVWGEWRTE